MIFDSSMLIEINDFEYLVDECFYSDIKRLLKTCGLPDGQKFISACKRIKKKDVFNVHHYLQLHGYKEIAYKLSINYC